LIGVLAAQGPVQRFKADKLPGIVDQLHKAADEVAKALS
jgi:DNA-binding IclR family transcriptional regulator